MAIARLGMREWCMLDPSRPKSPCCTPATSVCTALSFWKLPKSWSRFLTHCRAPPTGQNPHRHSRISIGTYLLTRPFRYCRSALNSAGRHKPPAEDSFDSKQNRQCMAWRFQAYVSIVMLPIMFWTQRSMSFDSRAINGAWWLKESNLPFDIKMHATNKWDPKTYQVGVKGLGDRESRHITSLEVWMSLDSQTWFDTPNQVM